jgi:hypothetical protein
MTRLPPRGFDLLPSLRGRVAALPREPNAHVQLKLGIMCATSVALAMAIAGCGSSGSSFGTGGTTGGVPSGTGGAVVNGIGGETGAQGDGGNSGEGLGGQGPGGGTGGAVTAGVGGGGGTTPGTGGRTTAGTGGMVVVAGTGGAVGAACPKPAGQICHEFFANDNSANHRVTYVNEFTSTAAGSVVWTANVPDLPADAGLNNSPRTIQVVDNAAAKSGKALLVSIDQGYAELDLVDGKQLLVVTSFRGISGAVRIPEDGTTALARGTDNTVLIVGAPPNTGSIVRMFALPAGDNLRAINRNPTTKHFWLTHTETIYEVTDTGQTVFTATMPTGSKGYTAWWRDGGGAYATTGDPSSVVEINAAKQIISTVGGKTAFPAFLDFFSGFVRLANGDYVIANWLGHLGSATGEFATHQVIEFTPANKLVWQWGSTALARQITNVFVVR